MRRGLATAVMLVAMSSSGCSSAPPDPSHFVDVPGIGTTRVDVPRATSPGGSPCSLSFPTDDTIAQRALALRGLGFFADRADVSDAAFGSAIEAEVKAAWGSQIQPDDPFMELLVAEQDADRVWWQDLEADVVDENQVYVSTIEDWAAISVGSFTPSDVSESWDSDTGPVTVAFTLEGQPQALHPAYLEDWIDPTIIGRINELIAPSGRRFEIVKAFDQTAFVLALTEAERGALEARGWCFE